VSAGDRERLERLFRGNSGDVLAFLARRTAVREDAADLLAEVFLVAWRRIDSVPAGDAGRLWLFGVARRVLANHLRAARAQTGLAEQLAAELRTASVPAPDELGQVVREELARLSRADREVLTLSYWEGFTPAEIGRIVGRPAATIRVRIHRARRRLERCLAARRMSTAQALEAMRAV
jgi:RNA polymerase sigma-70 factor (ECF subfamily)